MLPLNVVVVSASLELQQAFASILGPWQLAPIIASSVGEAEEILSSHSVSLIFCSDEFPPKSIDAFIRRTARSRKKVPVVVVSRGDDRARFLNILERGVLDYELYPLNEMEIERVVMNAFSLARPNSVQRVVTATGISLTAEGRLRPPFAPVLEAHRATGCPDEEHVWEFVTREFSRKALVSDGIEMSMFLN